MTPDQLYRVIAEMSRLKHGPGGTGIDGPCDARCRKCKLENLVMTDRADRDRVQAEPSQPKPTTSWREHLTRPWKRTAGANNSCADPETIDFILRQLDDGQFHFREGTSFLSILHDKTIEPHQAHELLERLAVRLMEAAELAKTQEETLPIDFKEAYRRGLNEESRKP